LFLPGGSCVALLLQLWSAPLPARWGNSILNTVLSPMRQAHQSTMALLWEVGLSPHPTLSLCASHCLFLMIVLLLWEVGLSPHPCFQTFSLSCLHSLRVWLLAPPSFFEAGSMFHSTSTVGGTLQFNFYAFQFYWRACFNLPRDYAELYFQRVGRGVTCGVHCSPVGSADLCRQL
jgi:hypothetical protein